MRVLISYDGSAGADQAVELVETIRWPIDSIVRIVGVAEPPAMLLAAPWAPASPAEATEVDAQMVVYLEDRVAEAVRRLRASVPIVEGVVHRGHPATVVVDEARRFGADLVVAGSRGHGPIASLVLGSVSAEIVDHAPCPVLVARRPTLKRVIFATDGSNASGAAESILVRWPIFDGLSIRVVSVADVVEPWHTGIAPTMYRQVIDAYTKDLQESEAQHRQIATEAAARVVAAGRVADAITRTGDAAARIIAAAEEWNADLVVIGSRGRTGLTRMVLGSVARNVLHGGHTSVLIVHSAPAEAGGR
jgi:nucleotide-binding universal stress UspA family protein